MDKTSFQVLQFILLAQIEWKSRFFDRNLRFYFSPKCLEENVTQVEKVHVLDLDYTLKTVTPKNTKYIIHNTWYMVHVWYLCLVPSACCMVLHGVWYVVPWNVEHDADFMAQLKYKLYSVTSVFKR